VEIDKIKINNQEMMDLIQNLIPLDVPMKHPKTLVNDLVVRFSAIGS